MDTRALIVDEKLSMDGTGTLLIAGETTNVPRSLPSYLKENRWLVDHEKSLKEAASTLKSKHYEAGLILIDDDTETNVSDIEKCLEASSLNWMALIHPDLLDNASILRLMRRHCYAYHVLPGRNEQVECILRHACAMRRLHELQRKNDATIVDDYEMVGTTPGMKQLFDTVRRVAAVDAPVFISGESGTGKELAAHAIHERSQRRDGPFIAVNCGALPSNLIQSELFGHEKGAFTGASQRKIGKVEAAQGGTLFLDEIGDLPLEMQVNLLRFLEDHLIQRIGSTKEITVDVRILAATHVDLEKAVKEGRFREDLYHRLNVLQIFLPPLRERQADIEVLARFFFDKFANEKASQVKGFSQEALRLMQCHSWPGNIRELINRVRRALVMCETRLIKPEDLGLERRQSSRGIITLEQARDRAEYEALVSALGRNRYKIQNAARELGVSRVTLYRLMEKHRIHREVAVV
ncbi:sigma-54 dependent transcriptional regulator [Halomonas faecis]|uniref:sigma-54 dependent transcriptional regulator n=1 Tax=Halomonas faecis TaxID=1562110 RepID=UPI001F09CA4F|nr:sigma-54 dependent transcriptional regulator [Halomonas faecis]